MRAAICAQFDVCCCGDFRHQHNRKGRCFCDCAGFVFAAHAGDEEIARQLAREVLLEAELVVKG